MNKLQYDEIRDIFNNKIFEKGKANLLKSLASSPHRYVGIFRATKPQTKIIQNITQSHEIKFGDAFEILIRKAFETLGYVALNTRMVDDNNKYVDLDQLFEFNNKIIFIEQKLRDDHDSTKKKGQIDNFGIKIELLKEKYSNKDITSYFYFVDDSLRKNKKFYLEEIQKLKGDLSLEINLCYGSELFQKEGVSQIWEDDIVSFLHKWRKDLPSFPELNFDLNYQETFDEIKGIKPLLFEKIFGNNEILDEIFPIIFPENKTLQLLATYFYEKSSCLSETAKEQNRYAKLHSSLKAYLNKS